MTVRVAVGTVAVAAMSLLTCGCASREAGSGNYSATAFVDTFTQPRSVAVPSLQPAPAPRPAPACDQGAIGTGFAFSIAVGVRGYATPREAAVQFSRHNEVSAPAVAAAAWTITRSAGGYALDSAQVAVHVTRLRTHGWIVDSGTVCR